MRSSDPAKRGMPHPALHSSRRDFLVVCLGFLGASCASSTTHTHPVAPLSTPTAPPSMATPAASYHGTYSSQGGQIWGVSWSPDGTRIASASANGTVQVWDPNSGHTLLTYTGHSRRVQTVAWSPDGRHLASAGDDKSVQVWDATTGTLRVTYHGHTNDVLGVAWSPDSRRISSGSDDGTAQVWDAVTGKTQLIYKGHTSFVKHVPWSPDGRRIASASDDGTVQIWDSTTGRTLVTLGISGVAARWTVAWSPDGRRVASAFGNDLSQNGFETAGVWDATMATPAASYHGTYSSQGGQIWGVSWSPDGTRIASGGADATAQIWDASTGRTLAVEKRDRLPVWDVAWSPSGKRLAVASWDGTVIIWQPPV